MFGDSRGRIFQEDTTGEVAFEGDAFIVSGHLIFGDVGGDNEEGKHIARAWSYVESEKSGWELRIWSGDERAYPPFESLNLIGDIRTTREEIAASELTGTYPAVVVPPAIPTHTTRAQPRTVHIHKPNKEVSGRGFTWEFIFHNPVNVLFYGFGAVIEPGVARRPLVEAQVYGDPGG